MHSLNMAAEELIPSLYYRKAKIAYLFSFYLRVYKNARIAEYIFLFWESYDNK